MTSPKPKYGALVWINGIMANSVPTTAGKQVSAIFNNS